MYDHSISIFLLRNILFDNQTFTNYITGQEKFSFIKCSELVEPLNHYMSLLITFNFSMIDKAVFERINFINEKYSRNNYYDPSICTSNHSCLVDIHVIEMILEDENYFQMFMNFDKYSNYFKEASLDYYLYLIVNYIKFLKSKQLPISEIVSFRFQKISEQFSIDLKLSNTLFGDLPKGVLDSDLEKYISSKINYSVSKFSIAIQIYREICKISLYDATFFALKQDLSNPIAKNIYDKSISEINLNNTKMICTTWADLFATFLIQHGYKARVCGDFHKVVVFDCEGVILQADATKQIVGKDGFYFNDFTRSKLNMPLAGITCLNENYNINPLLDQLYHDSKLEEFSFMKELEMLFFQYPNLSNMSFDEKIAILSNKGRTTSLVSTEYVSYLVTIMRRIFSPKELKKLHFYITYFKNNDDYVASYMFLLEDINYGTVFYVFNKVLGIVRYSKEMIKQLVSSNSLVIPKMDEKLNRLFNSATFKTGR